MQTVAQIPIFIRRAASLLEDMPMYALLIHGNNVRANLTPEQRKSVKAFVTAIKALKKR